MKFHFLLVAVTLLSLTGCATGPDPRLKPIDEAVLRAFDFLLARQDPSGAWKSTREEHLADGFALTPMVGLALRDNGPKQQQSLDKGLEFLLGLDVKRRATLDHPIMTVSSTIVLFNDRKDDGALEARQEFLIYLRGQQLSEKLGWKPEDAAYGSFSEQESPPHRGPNEVGGSLSGSRFALRALQTANIPANDPAVQAALVFVDRCADKEGGFHEAGQTAVTGDATADGVRALLAGGRPVTDPQVQAARKWLLSHFEERKSSDPTFYYYACTGSTALLNTATPNGEDRTWARLLADRLMKLQRADGSWASSASEKLEDEPLIATPYALRALLQARQVLVKR